VSTPSPIEGAFAEFAHVPDEQSINDPAFSHATAGTVRVPGAATNNQWLRLSLTATAPNNYPGLAGRYVYPRAAFARPYSYVSSAADAEIHQLSYMQFEKTPPATDIEEDLVGQNLLTMEQGSYEGRVLYLPTSVASTYQLVDDNATFRRVTDVVSCGEYAGFYRYISPTPGNSYDQVKNFGTYTNVRNKRSTYSGVRYTPWTPADGGQKVSTGSVQPLPGPGGYGLLPTRDALVPVQAGFIYRAQVSAATDRPSLGFYCQVNAYDANFNFIGSPMIARQDPVDIDNPDSTVIQKSRIATAGARRWQTAWGYVKMPANTVWAAVVPRITAATTLTTITFWADEHRLMLPTTQAGRPAGASPARPWQPAKQLTVKLRANRVNYVSNPSFQNNVTGYRTNAATELTTKITRSGEGVTPGCAEFEITGPFAVQVLVDGSVQRTGMRAVTSGNALIDQLKPDTTYTASAYVRPKFESVPVTIWAHDGSEWVRGETSRIYPTTGGAPWDRIKVTFTTAVTHSGTLDLIVGYAANSVQYLFGPIPPDSDDQVWRPYTGTASAPNWSATAGYGPLAHVTYQGAKWEAIVANGPFTTRSFMRFQADQLLVEEDSRLLDYFDGNFPSADYMWEAGGQVGNSRSHYYRGRSRNQYRLERALQEHIPLGGAYRILYATAP
jgi:hypothetical protein